MGIDAITGAASQITGAIRQAARSTGASFEYLLTTAQIESSLNPAAQASTSSAKGLYQFIDQTWLATMKSKGAALGYGRYADAIVQDASGQYDVPDPATRSAIMKLRSDPTASALMAGAFASNNAAQLAASIGRAPNEGELYIAHFLGADGAGKLIAAATNQPRASAVAMFPQAAAANPTIFYTSSGSPRSVTEVYGKLTSRFEVARSVAFNLRGTLAPSPDTAGVTQAFAAASSPPAIQDSRPLFQAMFTDRARAVAQTVSELWTPPGAEANAARPLNLFGDAPSDPRKLFGS
jgi:Transglycosylase SLT domain